MAAWSCSSPTTKNLAVNWAPHGCSQHGIIHPDLVVAAGFSYQVVTAHNGCLQLEVTVHGKAAHAAIPASGVDALQAATSILAELYQQNALYRGITSQVTGISHPYLNVGTIEGGTNTNVVPGRGAFQAGPPHDPGGKPHRGRSHAACADPQHRSRDAGHHRGHQTHLAGTGLAAFARQPTLGAGDSKTW